MQIERVFILQGVLDIYFEGVQEVLPQLGAIGTLFLKFLLKSGMLLILNLSMSQLDDLEPQSQV